MRQIKSKRQNGDTMANNASEGVTAFKYLVEREGIVAAGGVISSDVGLAVSREAEAPRFRCS
ncbi:MAG TPA: hypothetical protein VFR66_05930 [Burkholderiales bacterium]|nr:hypothetical protein [Burkholderiales bacterium]